MHGKLVCEYLIFQELLIDLCYRGFVIKWIRMSQEHTHLRTVNMYICYVIVFLRWVLCCSGPYDRLTIDELASSVNCVLIIIFIIINKCMYVWSSQNQTMTHFSIRSLRNMRT